MQNDHNSDACSETLEAFCRQILGNAKVAMSTGAGFTLREVAFLAQHLESLLTQPSRQASMAQPRTVCVNCQHFRNLSKGFNAHVWYNHFCAASAAPSWIDPVTGERVTANGYRYKHCRDVNTGDCPLYEAKDG